jgi:protease secretion system outer membrane protein
MTMAARFRPGRVHGGLLAALLAACGPATSWAQGAPASAATAPAGVLTLSQAYQAAFAQDAQLRAARAATDARRERLPQARSQLLPQVGAQASRNWNDLISTNPGPTGDPFTSTSRYFSGTQTLTVRQGLYRPEQWADVKQAQAQVADANAQLQKEVQNLAVRVAGAYAEALFAEDQLALVLAQKSTYSTQVEAARRRFQAGAGVRTDIDEAQARLDMAIAQELETRQQVAYSRRALQVMVNQPVGRLAKLDPARMKLPPVGPLDDWISRAELTSPEILSLVAQRDASRQDIEKARAGHLPTVDAIAQYSINKSDNILSIHSRYQSRSIGLQVNVPLYSGGYVTSKQRQAVADLERAEEALEATRRDLALRIEKEHRGVTEGEARIKALEQAVRSAETVVESNRRSFQAGSRTLVDVLNSEEQRATAVRDLANARYSYLLSRVRLASLTGEADAASIDVINTVLAP